MSVTIDSFPWFKNYPKGIDYELNPDAYSSLLDLMESGFEKFRGQPAYSFMDKTLNYEDIDKNQKILLLIYKV